LEAGVMRADTHQHLWTEEFVEALERRSTQPYIRREHGVARLFSAGEPPYVIDLESEQPQRRLALIDADGLDLAAVAISSPIGVEALARDEAQVLIDAWLDGAFALRDRFAVWGPIVLDRPCVDEVDTLVARGCVGISIPAGAIAGRARLGEMLPILKRVAECGVPLFVHPGRAPGQAAVPVAADEPLWWRPLTEYVWQMQAAWFTFVSGGRRELPELKVLWTMLAGGAHFMHERFTARGGDPIDLRDPLNFYETSSYGPDAVETTAALVGESQLVYGSDRPVVVPEISDRDRLHQRAGAELLQKGHV
jgi:6-methylsalicylate decarboxylase